MRIGICAIARDEDRLIAEWVGYYLLIGATHIHIVDDNSVIPVTTSLSALLAKYPSQITVERLNHDFHNPASFKQSPLYDSKLAAKEPNMQLYMYHRMWKRYRHFDWIGFLDIDEFVWLARFTSLRHMLHKYRSYSQVLLRWVFYGHNYHMHHPNGLCISNFTSHTGKLDQRMKAFVRPSHARRVKNHNSVLRPGCQTFIVPRKRNVDAVPHIKHYRTQAVVTTLQRRFFRLRPSKIIKQGVWTIDKVREIFTGILIDPEFLKVHSVAIHQRYGRRLADMLGVKYREKLRNRIKHRYIFNPIHVAQLNAGVKGKKTLTSALLRYISNPKKHVLQFARL